VITKSEEKEHNNMSTVIFAIIGLLILAAIILPRYFKD
jgi:hypothetical protein